MSWVRLDDLFLDHPKIVGLTDRQKLVHLAGMLYAARHDTRGALPRQALKSIGASAAHIRALEEASLWKRDAHGELVIHDFLAYNGRTIDERVAAYLHDHPEAGANEVLRVVGGKREVVLKLVKHTKETGTPEPLTPVPENHNHRFPGTSPGGSQSVPGVVPNPVPFPNPTTKGSTVSYQPEPEPEPELRPPTHTNPETANGSGPGAGNETDGLRLNPAAALRQLLEENQ